MINDKTKAVLTIALLDDGTVAADLTDGMSLNAEQVAHGFGKMLATIYQLATEIPKSSGFDQADTERFFVHVLSLGKFYYEQKAELSGTMGTTTEADND